MQTPKKIHERIIKRPSIRKSEPKNTEMCSSVRQSEDVRLPVPVNPVMMSSEFESSLFASDFDGTASNHPSRPIFRYDKDVAIVVLFSARHPRLTGMWAEIAANAVRQQQEMEQSSKS